MVQKPLVVAVVAVAAVLMMLSFVMVAFPDTAADMPLVYGAVGAVAIVILIVMLLRMKVRRRYGFRNRWESPVGRWTPHSGFYEKRSP